MSSSKKINAPYPSNGVYGNDGVFYPNGSTPPKEVLDAIDNPRAFAGNSEEYAADEQVVGAPTPEQIAEAERLAAAQSGTAPSGDGDGDDAGGDGGDGGSDSDDGGKQPAAKKAPAKKATAKKAPAKKAASPSS